MPRLKPRDSGRSEVLGEDTYPIELMAADPIAQAICADLNLSEEGAKDLSAAVASIKVSAKKPS